MSRSSLRKAVVIGALLAALVLVARRLRGGPAPAFERSGPASASWPTLRPTEPAPDWVGPAAAPADADGLAFAPAAEPSQVPSWLEAMAGPPPGSHPVKAKLGSGIYHLPGMMNYDRTKADRWYRTAAEAEADGLRVAKR